MQYAVSNLELTRRAPHVLSKITNVNSRTETAILPNGRASENSNNATFRRLDLGHFLQLFIDHCWAYVVKATVLLQWV